MARLRLLLWVSGLTAMGLATVAGTLAVRQGLVPLGQLNSQLDAMDVQLLHERVPLEGLPGELRPTVVKINELLGRLAESFERERRFGADASHELRTPLAAIRSILDVALSRERSVAEHRAAAQAALAVSRQMSTLVDGLLALARLDASQEPAQPERVALPELLDECCAGLAPRAAARGLRLETSVAPDAALFLDRERLRTIVVNLLTNAVEYTAEGGAILVTSDPAYGTVLEVRDSGPPIPADAVERVFDRFFRLDSARTAVGEHWGIGLALVRALCNTLGLSVVAENTPDGWVAFRITFAAGVSQGHEQTARQERILAGPLPSAPVRS